MKSQKIISIVLCAALLATMFTGCTGPAFLTSSKNMYARYRQGMCEVPKYTYSMGIDWAVHAENYSVIDDLRTDGLVKPDSVKESITVGGSYDRANKVFSAVIGAAGERRSRTFNHQPLTNILVQDSTVYVDTQSIYQALTSGIGEVNNYPADAAYVSFDASPYSEMLWSASLSEDPAAPEFAKQVQSVLDAYLSGHASYEKSKGYAGFAITDNTPSSVNTDLLNTIYNSHDAVADYIGNIISLMCPSDLQDTIIQVTAASREDVLNGQGSWADPMDRIGESLHLLEMIRVFSEDDVTLLKQELIDNFNKYELAYQYKSEIDELDSGYGKTISFTIGTTHNSESLIPLVTLDIRFEMDTVADQPVEIPAETANPENVIPQMIQNLVGTEGSAEPEVTDSIDAQDSMAPEIVEGERLPFEQVFTPGTFPADIGDSSSSGNFSFAKLNDISIYGTTDELYSSGIVLLDLTAGKDAETEDVEIQTACSTRLDVGENQFTTVTQTISEFPDSYTTCYGDEISLLTSKLYPDEDVPENPDLVSADGWTYRASQMDGRYVLYAAKIDQEHLTESITGVFPNVDLLNEFQMFLMPSSDPHSELKPDDSASRDDDSEQEDLQGIGSDSQGMDTHEGEESDMSQEPPMTQGPSTDRVRENGFKRVEYESHSLWAIAGAVPERSSHGHTDKKSGYTITEYSSYGSVNGASCYLSDQSFTYTNGETIASHYDNDAALYEEVIVWPLNIYAKQADETAAVTSDLQTEGQYTYQAISLTENGTKKTILIAVHKKNDTEYETIMLQAELDQAATITLFQTLAENAGL